MSLHKTFKKTSLKILFVILLTSSTDLLLAKPISTTINGLVVNAEIFDATDKNKPFFLILHGTLAWHGMELPKTIQQILNEEGFGSLAFTLSLGENNRHNFFDCSQPIVSGHDDAQTEIDLWLTRLTQMGYSNVYLIGHSRGGSQIASFALNNPNKVSRIFLLAPLVWVKSDVHKQYQNNLIKANPTTDNLEQLLIELKTNTDITLVGQKMLHCENATVSGKAFLSYYDELPEKNSPTLLSTISIPSKVYLADADPLTAQFLSQQAIFSQNSNVHYLMIEDSDHYFRDFAVEDVVSDILKTVTTDE